MHFNHIHKHTPTDTHTPQSQGEVYHTGISQLRSAGNQISDCLTRLLLHTQIGGVQRHGLDNGTGAAEDCKCTAVGLASKGQCGNGTAALLGERGDVRRALYI